MNDVQRSNDVVESHAANFLGLMIASILFLAVGIVLFIFRGGGMFTVLSVILIGIGLILAAVAIWWVSQIRKVTRTTIKCPCCNEPNYLTEFPQEDFDCVHCHRMVPIRDGEVMPVFQVRCGFCNTLNFYSDKSEVLICEECDREIPILNAEGEVTKSVPKGFARVDDEAFYELVLTDPGNHTEEMIATLQQMLALNRNQVRDIMENLPATLLTGINRRKADMLNAQLSVHGAVAQVRQL